MQLGRLLLTTKAPLRRGLPSRLARIRRNWYIDSEVRSPFRPSAGQTLLARSLGMINHSPCVGCSPARRLLVWRTRFLAERAELEVGQWSIPFPVGALMVLIAPTLNACGGDLAGGSEHQQTEGRPLPKYSQASLPAGRYYTTEFEPSLSFRISGDNWRFEGPSGTLGDPEHPDYLFFQKVPEQRSPSSTFGS